MLVSLRFFPARVGMRRTQRPPAMIAVHGILAAQTNASVFAVSVAKAVNAVRAVTTVTALKPALIALAAITAPIACVAFSAFAALGAFNAAGTLLLSL